MLLCLQFVPGVLRLPVPLLNVEYKRHLLVRSLLTQKISVSCLSAVACVACLCATFLVHIKII